MKKHLQLFCARIKLWAVQKATSEKAGVLRWICRILMCDVIHQQIEQDMWYTQKLEQDREELLSEVSSLREKSQADEAKSKELLLNASSVKDREQERVLSIIYGILKEADLNSPEKMLEDNMWSIYEKEPEEGPGWNLATGYCQLGGCEMEEISFTSQQAALIYGRLLTALGIKAHSAGVCSNCYPEYIQSIV